MTHEEVPEMARPIHPGRFTADVDDEVVVFLIGMRVNRWWKVRRWLQVFLAMPRMLRRLLADPELGLLGMHTVLLGPRTTMMIQYWRSAEHLERFARAPELPHLEAWRRFNREIAASGDVGIYHETYVAGPGRTEAVYVNMPVFGLAAATRHVPVAEVGHTAAQRLAHRGA